jgi:hypothetical protein
MLVCLSLGSLRKVDENCTLLGYYAASSDNFLPSFRNELAVPSSGFKNRKYFWNPDT